MRRLRNPFTTGFLKVICGLSTARSIACDSTVPREAEGCTVTQIADSGEYRFAIVALPFEGRKGARLYRVIAWRVYRDKQNHQRATTALYAEDLDTVLTLASRIRKVDV